MADHHEGDEVEGLAVHEGDMVFAHIDPVFVLIPHEAAELIDACLKDQLVGDGSAFVGLVGRQVNARQHFATADVGGLEVLDSLGAEGRDVRRGVRRCPFNGEVEQDAEPRITNMDGVRSNSDRGCGAECSTAFGRWVGSWIGRKILSDRGAGVVDQRQGVPFAGSADLCTDAQGYSAYVCGRAQHTHRQLNGCP